MMAVIRIDSEEVNLEIQYEKTLSKRNNKITQKNSYGFSKL